MPSRDAFFAALGSLPAAIALLTLLRWPQGIACPHCGSTSVGGHGRYGRCRDLRSVPALPAGTTAPLETRIASLHGLCLVRSKRLLAAISDPYW